MFYQKKSGKSQFPPKVGERFLSHYFHQFSKVIYKTNVCPVQPSPVIKRFHQTKSMSQNQSSAMISAGDFHCEISAIDGITIHREQPIPRTILLNHLDRFLDLTDNDRTSAISTIHTFRSQSILSYPLSRCHPQTTGDLQCHRPRAALCCAESLSA